MRQTYANYETGLRKPSYEVLFKLSGLYDISMDDLSQLSIELDRDTSHLKCKYFGTILICFLESCLDLSLRKQHE
ncbi:MAG: helix-turn-helix domain-containing protein [Lachnospiraceae bacterium]|nr:helix-turn-helix domain-containing protein [Lachnospiraceae bacterium]